MYYGARDMGYRLAGMRPDPAMLIGMAGSGVGLAAALYGLMPGGARAIQQRAVLGRRRMVTGRRAPRT